MGGRCVGWFRNGVWLTLQVKERVTTGTIKCNITCFISENLGECGDKLSTQQWSRGYRGSAGKFKHFWVKADNYSQSRARQRLIFTDLSVTTQWWHEGGGVSSLQTEECLLNWGMAEGDAGQVKSGDIFKRMSLLTHKWGLISRGGVASCSGAEKRHTAVTRPPPGLIPQRMVILDIRETGAVESCPRGRCHEPQPFLYHSHDRCLSFSWPFITACKHDYQEPVMLHKVLVLHEDR